MKRQMMLLSISLLAEAGIFSIIFGGYYLFSTGDLLKGLVIAAVLTGFAGLIVMLALDENLKGKSPRAATRKARNK